MSYSGILIILFLVQTDSVCKRGNQDLKNTVCLCVIISTQFWVELKRQENVTLVLLHGRISLTGMPYPSACVV